MYAASCLDLPHAMLACIYISGYAYIYVNVYTYIHARTHTYVYIYVCTSLEIWKCIHTYICKQTIHGKNQYIWLCIYIHTLINVCLDGHTCIHMYKHIHTRIHICIFISSFMHTCYKHTYRCMLKHISIHKWTNTYVHVKTLLRKASIFSESTFSTKCEKNLRAHLRTHAHIHKHRFRHLFQSDYTNARKSVNHVIHLRKQNLSMRPIVLSCECLRLHVTYEFTSFSLRLHIYIHIHVCLHNMIKKTGNMRWYVSIHMYTCIYTDTYIYICTNTLCVYLYVVFLSICLSSMLVRVCVCMCNHCTYA